MSDTSMADAAARAALGRNDLEAYWMPFTANRQFKSAPRLLISAKDMHYVMADGRRLLDGCAGLWCVNAGHCRDEIVAAIAGQAADMDYATAFQMGHPAVFELANRLTELVPGDLDHVFFTNSGSEAVDTALKIALAYHQLRGEGRRQRLIGRERGYHGVGFGGMSVGGIANNRKPFGPLLAAVDYLPHTHDLEHNAFSKGQPEWGAHFADALESLVALHDASTIAAVIVEPMAGSAGVLIPPKGYLGRLRGICDKYGILLIFDEVITGFGRLGASFAAEYFGIVPDIITAAKGLTSGTVPMGAVFVRKDIHEAFMKGPELSPELFHGYTYSGHPLACAAALATLKLYAEEDLFARANSLAGDFEDAAHGLEGLPHVVDIRNLGLVAGIELEPVPGEPGRRGYDVFLACLNKGVLIRVNGDIIALSPPLIIENLQTEELFRALGEAIRETA